MDAVTEPLVYVVVLAWNQKEMTVECIRSLLASQYSNMRLLVVDNGSTDGTSETLWGQFPQIEIVRSPINRGIAGGYNIGLEYALAHGAEYILVSNNDIIAEQTMLRFLVEALESIPKAGIGLPKIYHYFGDKSRLWCTGAYWRKFPPSIKMMGVNAKDSQRFSKLREIEYAPSCCLLIRRNVLETIGYFDTGYFFYYDDWDFSARARKAGYSIWFIPQAKIWHKVSMSTQKSRRPERWWYILGRSTVRYYLRHSTSQMLGLYLTWFVIREFIKLKPEHVPPFLAGVGHEVAITCGWTI
ncbi:MAG: glycosyltransferase family 2 protein [Anaerolineae bacterium]